MGRNHLIGRSYWASRPGHRGKIAITDSGRNMGRNAKTLGGDMRVKASSLEGRKAHAYLDGVDVSADCVEADDEQGWVELLVRDKKGNIKVGFDRELLVIQRFGKVVIKL